MLRRQRGRGEQYCSNMTKNYLYISNICLWPGYMYTVSRGYLLIQYPRCWGRHHGGEGCQSLGDCPWCGPSNIRHLGTALQSPLAPPVTSNPSQRWRTRHRWLHRPRPDSLGRLCVNAKLGAPDRRHGRETRAEVPRVM